jgi:hypothetical protein
MTAVAPIVGGPFVHLHRRVPFGKETVVNLDTARRIEDEDNGDGAVIHFSESDVMRVLEDKEQILRRRWMPIP